MSLIGATSMTLALLVGCGDSDDKPVTSKLGESCARTADCDSGLSCIDNVCYKTSAPPSGGSGGGGSVTPPEPRARGGEGESCASRLDCAEPLGCFNNRCTAKDDTGEGGAPAVSIHLGTRGESCRVNGDCVKDLACVPSAVSGSGVCDTASFGIEPTGLTCSGECTKAEDCCQLPISLHTASIKSCKDIADASRLGTSTAPRLPPEFRPSSASSRRPTANVATTLGAVTRTDTPAFTAPSATRRWLLETSPPAARASRV